MDNCPICLEDLDAASPVLPCGHRCHASCLGQLAEANGWAATRRGTVIPCPSCRQEARVAAPTPVAAFGVGDEVYALWGHRWYPGVVDEVLEDGYEIAWDAEDATNEVPAARVRARVQPVPAPTAVATPRDTPEPQAAPARPPSRSLRRDPRCPCGPPPSRSLRDRRCLRRPLRTRLEPKAPAPAKKIRSEEALERQRAHRKKYKREERERERARKAKKQKRIEELRENYPNQRADNGDADDASAHTPAPAAETCVAPPRRSGRAPAPKVIFDAPDERPPSHQRQAGCPKKRKAGAYAPRCVEGATQKVNGKWTNAAMFPGREFDNLREYRAAKEQRAARREEYSAQIPDSSYQKEYRARHARTPCAH